jgi:Fic family protein
MRTGTFISKLTGEAKYKAFTPNLLPFEVQMDDDLQDLLSRSSIALGRLDGVVDVLPNVDFFILMYVRKEATLSSQIEGTQATFVDVLKAEAKIEDSEIHKDVDEVLNYINAMNYGIERMKNLPLSLRLTKEIHEKLLVGVRGEWKTPGEFRTSQNWVGGSSIQTANYVPPSHEDALSAMENLEEYIQTYSPTPVLIRTGLMHAQFETIHPFLDGNGRVGRLLITFYLCQQGILSKPLLYLSDFFKEHKQVYYDKLNAFRTNDDIEGWLKFFLEGVLVTSQKAVANARKIRTIRDQDIEKVASLGRSAQKGLILLKELYKHPIVRVRDVEKIVGITNPNALELVSKFLNAGILEEITGKERYRVFAYQKYINIFNKEN